MGCRVSPSLTLGREIALDPTPQTRRGRSQNGVGARNPGSRPRLSAQFRLEMIQFSELAVSLTVIGPGPPRHGGPAEEE